MDPYQEHGTTALLRPPDTLDYSLTGENANRAIELGLAEADWYQCPVPRATMRKLLERKDGPAIRDTLIWIGLLLGFAFATTVLWGSGWAILPYMGYAVIYASTSDSRWHESSHGTAFKTDWMNNVLYEVASFMVMREATRWRWSHTRHHSDTIIVGRDPEIAVPRPPDIKAFVLAFTGLTYYPYYFRHILTHSFGKVTEDEKTYIPTSEFPALFLRARIYLGIYLGIFALAIYTGSVLPLLFIGLPTVFGSWLMPVYGYTQHAGLAENVLDHRLNCRTVYMNIMNRYLYWNMNYHVEHHMFPLVPYHALPTLHRLVKDDMPEPYPNLIAAWKEIIPSVRKQVKDPSYHVKRRLPQSAPRVEEGSHRSNAKPDSEGWLEICAAADLGTEDVIRFDHNRNSFALYRDTTHRLFATDGICTHGNTHLSNGLVKGNTIECPKHNGRFTLEDGSPARAPVCRGLATYPIEERRGRIWLNVLKAGGAGAVHQTSYVLRVVSNQSVSTFIKELVLEPVDPAESVAFTPGDYLQVDIPNYEQIHFRDFEIPEAYATVWERHQIFDLCVENPDTGRRNNYSLANSSRADGQLMFNIRIATPPPGQDCPPGVGSSYMFSLKPGDTITAIGSFGDFHIKPTQREMVYIGGGAGMAPLRAHIAELFEHQATSRKVSYWYGARSRQEIYYQAYFEALAADHPNFEFHLALSDALNEDQWTGHTGFIHEVVLIHYLENHPNPMSVEFYLCGPPMMISACTRMLVDRGISTEQIAYDEF